jgi:predicted ester cyclase
MHATNTGTLVDGTPSTGKKIRLPGVTISQYEGDKVVSERTYFDLHDLLKQLGLGK